MRDGGDAFHGATPDNCYGARTSAAAAAALEAIALRSGCFCSVLAAGSPHADSITMAQGEKNSGGGMCCSAGDNGFCQNTTQATDWARKETVHKPRSRRFSPAAES